MASHSIAMLVYVTAGSPAAAAVSDPNLQSALKKSSKVLKFVNNRAELNQVLSRGRYDVILADSADVAGITQQLEAMGSHTVVVPVLYQATKAEASQLAKQYHVVLKTPGKTRTYMSALDEAIEMKAVRDQTRIIAKK
jgi:ABC-type amino acid transport substrate-binding protein